MFKRAFRFILSILMLAVLFLPFDYIDPSKSVITKIVALFEVEYFGWIYFAYVVVIFANFVVSLIGACTDNYKFMSISRNTSFVSSILMFNYAIMNTANVLTIILVSLGAVTLFLSEKNIAEYQYGGKRKKNINDILRFVCVTVCFVSVGLNKPEYGYSAMYYHQNLLKGYGSLANGINLFLCFMFLFTLVLFTLLYFVYFLQRKMLFGVLSVTETTPYQVFRATETAK